mgnify:CR=1 FL=1
MTMDELQPGQSAYITAVGGEGALRHHSSAIRSVSAVVCGQIVTTAPRTVYWYRPENIRQRLALVNSA